MLPVLQHTTNIRLVLSCPLNALTYATLPVQALAAAQQAIRKFEKAGTPWQRPPDYYAEMVKSDDHMAKVKQQLMHETQQMEAVEQRYGHCTFVQPAHD